MNRLVSLTSTAAIVLAMGMMTGCEWEGSDDYNLSRGAGANMNISGVYTPRGTDPMIAGIDAVNRMTIQQTGDSLWIRDNGNSTYEGNAGAPGVVAGPNQLTGNYPAGGVLLQIQVSFNGFNQLTKADASFVGVLRALAKTEITGFKSTTTVNAGSGGTTIENVDTIEYSLTEANTLWILEGQWIENGNSYAFNAEANAVGGVVWVNVANLGGSSGAQSTGAATPSTGDADSGTGMGSGS